MRGPRCKDSATPPARARLLLHGQTDRPLLFEGYCNASLFNIWLAQPLLPSLLCASVIGMDNATFHETAQTRQLQLIEEAGCEILYLPPYSPNLNLIEKLWVNLKCRRQQHPTAHRGNHQHVRLLIGSNIATKS